MLKSFENLKYELNLSREVSCLTTSLGKLFPQAVLRLSSMETLCTHLTRYTCSGSLPPKVQYMIDDQNVRWEGSL